MKVINDNNNNNDENDDNNDDDIPQKKLTVLPTWETLSKLSSTEMKTRGEKI